jgi:hypothetical protein
MSSNVAIRLEPTTVNRRSCGDRAREVQVRGAARAEAQEAEDHVLDALAHVGLAVRLDLDRLLAAAQVQHDGDVVGAERPQRVLVGAQLAEVEPVGVGCSGSPPVRRRRELRELGDPGWYSSSADHEQAAVRAAEATTRLGIFDGLGEWLLHEQCLPASSTARPGPRGGTGVARTIASSVSSPQQILRSP